jgi:arsenate reductase
MAAKILFVCIGNSCRSQMSEGFAKKHGGDSVEVWSAGSRPCGYVNSQAIAFMKEKGIDISSHTSKGLSQVPKVNWDYVITMGCGDICPYVASQSMEDWGISDPVGRPDSEFRMVRDIIEDKVIALMKRVKGQ